jgi:hypothetical protein
MKRDDFESISSLTLSTVVGGQDEGASPPEPPRTPDRDRDDFTTGGTIGGGQDDFTTGGTFGGEGPFTTGGSF